MRAHGARLLPLPAELGVLRIGVTPRELGSLGPAASEPLPFPLRREPLAEPRAECFRLLEVDAIDRMVLPIARGPVALRSAGEITVLAVLRRGGRSASSRLHARAVGRNR